MPKVITVKPKVSTIRPTINTASQMQAVKGNLGNIVKPLTRWIWRPIICVKASIVLKKHTYINERDRFKSVMAWVPKE